MTTFDRSTCDIVIAAMIRDGHADLLPMLGLVEHTGHATHRDGGHVGKSGRTVTRRPLWEEPAYPDLKPVGGKSCTTELGAGWLE